ncbi:MAG: hypothetical protein F6K11_23255 [Leptolyngbya sp. SIO3F4]|nr:hypothetical protein [Leptolyngbya sp. SIO3F4]
MKFFWKNYSLEVFAAIIALSTTFILYFVFRVLLAASQDDLTFISIANAGFLFVISQIYSRLKERREIKRKKAQDIFIEWHSQAVRDSRSFVSRWLVAHENQNDSLPSLGNLEIEAAKAYKSRYEKALVVSPDGNKQEYLPTPHELDNPELKELHFFRIYQFFERWSLLIKNFDIDQPTANSYMSSYKAWYMDNLIHPWAKIEKDRYIKASLEEIIKLVGSK